MLQLLVTVQLCYWIGPEKLTPENFNAAASVILDDHEFLEKNLYFTRNNKENFLGIKFRGTKKPLHHADTLQKFLISAMENYNGKVAQSEHDTEKLKSVMQLLSPPKTKQSAKGKQTFFTAPPNLSDPTTRENFMNTAIARRDGNMLQQLCDYFIENDKTYKKHKDNLPRVLRTAANANDINMVLILSTLSVDVTVPGPTTKETALDLAKKKGASHSDMVELLEALEAVHKTNSTEMTAT